MVDDGRTQDDTDDMVETDQMGVSVPRQDTPFSDPDDLLADEQDALDDTHPATDTNIESQEEYDVGLAGAAGASEPNKKDAVVAYHPEADKRNNSADKSS